MARCSLCTQFSMTQKSAIHRTHFNQALARINSYHHFNQALVQSKFISPFQSSAGSEQLHITISNKHKCTASHVTIGVEPIHFARSNKRGCRAQSFHFWFRATSFHHLEKHWCWASSATYGAEHHHSTVYISVAQGNSDALGNNLPPFHKSAGAGQHSVWLKIGNTHLSTNRIFTSGAELHPTAFCRELHLATIHIFGQELHLATIT